MIAYKKEWKRFKTMTLEQCLQDSEYLQYCKWKQQESELQRMLAQEKGNWNLGKSEIDESESEYAKQKGGK